MEIIELPNGKYKVIIDGKEFSEEFETTDKLLKFVELFNKTEVENEK